MNKYLFLLLGLTMFLIAGCASTPKIKIENLTDRSFTLSGKKVAFIPGRSGDFDLFYARQLACYVNSISNISVVRPDTSAQVGDFYASELDRWVNGMGQNGQDNQFLSKMARSLAVDYIFIVWLDKITQRNVTSYKNGTVSGQRKSYSVEVRMVPVDGSDGTPIKFLSQTSSLSKSMGCGTIFIRSKGKATETDYLDKAAYDTASAMKKQFLLPSKK